MIVYITATDKFFSSMIGKISKLIYVCNNSEELSHCEKMVYNRKDLKYIYLSTVKPRYRKSWYHVSWRDYKGNIIKDNPEYVSDKIEAQTQT